MKNKNSESKPERAEHNKRVIPLFTTYPMTDFVQGVNTEKDSPEVSDDDVLRAKKFVDQNHK